MEESEPKLPEPRNGAQPTETDEVEVLRALYGDADADGVFTGEGRG